MNKQPRSYSAGKIFLGDRELALKLANFFLENTSCLEVWIFGRMAREGLGADIDFMLVTDEGIYQSFKKKTLTLIGKYLHPHSSTTRYIAFLSALKIPAHGKIFEIRSGISYEHFKQLRNHEKMKVLRRVIPLDIFIFPVGWDSRLEELQEHLPHRNPHFMNNLASEVLFVDPDKRCFVKICATTQRRC